MIASHCFVLHLLCDVSGKFRKLDIRLPAVLLSYFSHFGGLVFSPCVPHMCEGVTLILHLECSKAEKRVNWHFEEQSIVLEDVFQDASVQAKEVHFASPH
jgi:hypothetical protein